MNSALHMNGRRLAVEHEVAAARQRRKVVDQVVKGRVCAKARYLEHPRVPSFEALVDASTTGQRFLGWPS